MYEFSGSLVYFLFINYTEQFVGSSTNLCTGIMFSRVILYKIYASILFLLSVVLNYNPYHKHFKQNNLII